MKKFLFWLVSIVVILIAADVIFGIAVKGYIKTHPLKGDYRATDHLIKDSVEDMVILGSSVALNSIDPNMLADSLGIEVYNGGANAQSFPFYLSIMEIIAEKNGLKTVILGIKEESLSGSGVGNRYNLLVPYYDSGFPGIDRRLESRNSYDRIMLKSSLYRYNTIWFRILLYAIAEPGIQGERGFIAKDLPSIFPAKRMKVENEPTSSERIEEFEQFLSLCSKHNIRLIVCLPPRYEVAADYNPARDFLMQRASSGEFELWYDVTDTPLSSDSTLFFDNDHLNYRGANEYTRILINRLKSR